MDNNNKNISNSQNGESKCNSINNNNSNGTINSQYMNSNNIIINSQDIIVRDNTKNNRNIANRKRRSRVFSGFLLANSSDSMKNVHS